MSNKIDFNSAEHQYEIHVDGVVAGYSEVREDDTTVTFTHTVVLDEYEGQGLAGELVTAALDDVRARDKKVIAQCEYVARFIEKHPAYADLLA
ncbi:MAG: GNAT family N-acetyltransferase [Aeromicrobium sp.]